MVLRRRRRQNVVPAALAASRSRVKAEMLAALLEAFCLAAPTEQSSTGAGRFPGAAGREWRCYPPSRQFPVEQLQYLGWHAQASQTYDAEVSPKLVRERAERDDSRPYDRRPPREELNRAEKKDHQVSTESNGRGR